MKTITIKLLNWYDKNHRTFPWRITPREQALGIRPDPYRVWLSEVMLQQTTVEAVKPYFEKFIKKWPDIFALSDASQEDILKTWAGLGYYSRARNLKACADKIADVYRGQFPRTPEELRTLPGIGEYTASAIAAIVFGHPHAVVDSNVERVISRLFCIKTTFPIAKKEIREQTQAIIPQQRAGDFAQAMMDLGASLCSPKRPGCFLCPLDDFCLGKQLGIAETLPQKIVKIKKNKRTGLAFVAVSINNRVYLQKRPNYGLLAGMTEVPNYFAPDGSKSDMMHAPFDGTWLYQGDIKHVFTHFSLFLSVYMAKDLIENSRKRGISDFWVTFKKLKQEALPTVMKKILLKALPSVFES